ncbi:MAG: 50S ribosomal protein L1 [Candidatus Dojkabacteria bacterium]
MAQRGKKYIAIRKKKPTGTLSLEEGIKKVKELSYSAFKGTVEFHLYISLPKDTDPKSLKGSITLPHSTSTKSVKIAVFTSPDNEKAAVDAGADFTSFEKLVKDVNAGKVEFDVAIATPDVMPKIAALGKVLGPKGLMPNPKTGTVTTDVANAVNEYRKGKMTFKSDDAGVFHFAVGSIELDEAKLMENIKACVDAASAIVGKRVTSLTKSAFLAPSMGPSVRVDVKSLDVAVE